MYPVIYKGIPLMPCSQKRANSMVRKGEAVFVRDKILGIYVKLKREPSGFNTQKLAMGIDTGTMYSGFSVVGDNVSFNLEVESSLRIQKRENIKIKSEDRRTYRRMRRRRLRHRETRFKNRTGNKVTATENYYYQMFRNFAQKLCDYFPVTDIVIEDVAHVHTAENTGSGFSPLEQIKRRLYDKLSEMADVHLSRANPRKIRMCNMASLRMEDGTVDDMDLKLISLDDKGVKSFYAHCIDSHSLACMVFGKHMPYSENMLYVSRTQVGIDKIRRKLERERPSAYGQKRTPRRHSKFRKLRVKVNDQQGNHGPWTYIQVTISEHTESKKKCIYGSSIKPKTGEHKYPGFRYWNSELIESNTGNVKYYVAKDIPKDQFSKIFDY